MYKEIERFIIYLKIGDRPVDFLVVEGSDVRELLELAGDVDGRA